MNELQEPQKIIICKLLMVNPCCAIRRCRRKVLFSDLKFINMIHERFSNLTVLNSHKLKERTAKSPIPHTHTHTSKEVVTGPLTFKNAPRAVLHAAAVVWS